MYFSYVDICAILSDDRINSEKQRDRDEKVVEIEIERLHDFKIVNKAMRESLYPKF